MHLRETLEKQQVTSIEMNCCNKFSDNVQFILNPIDLSFGSYRYLENW